MHFEFDDKHQGATRDPDDRLKGEILAALSDWRATYGTVGLELAWTVHQMLMQFIRRQQGLAAYIEFSAKASEIMRDEATELAAVVEEDHRQQMH